MVRRHAILPSSQNLRTGVLLKRGRFTAALKAVARKRKMYLYAVLHEQIQLLIMDLRELTPKDTGAAAGTEVGARRNLYPSHPAARLGLPIGNWEGASGWQPYEKDKGTHWAVINPMWDHYLVFRNYIAKTGKTHFLEEALDRFRARMRNIKKEL